MHINHLLSAALLSVAAFTFNACTHCTDHSAQPQLLGGKVLPEGYFSPDGMTIGKDGYIYVSINQVSGNWKFPAKIARISPDDKIEDFYTLPLHTKTKKTSPLGLVFDAAGNLYVSDNQAFVTDEPNLSGLLRINIRDGKPVGDELLVTGFNMSNGLALRGNFLYVAETNLGTKDKFLSGVYRFSLDELKGGSPIRVTGVGDPHLILSFETKSEIKVGANGVDFDSKGNLYVNNFGDVEVRKYSFNEKGEIVKEEIFAKPTEIAQSLDGLHIDSEDNLWAADFRGNAVVKITPKGKASLLGKSPVPSTGANGELDTSSECIRRGDKIYVSNIDLNDGPHKADEIQTISVIPLK
jgi:sugar lactone lactonase YvrE